MKVLVKIALLVTANLQLIFCFNKFYQKVDVPLPSDLTNCFLLTTATPRTNIMCTALCSITPDCYLACNSAKCVLYSAAVTNYYSSESLGVTPSTGKEANSECFSSWQSENDISEQATYKSPPGLLHYFVGYFCSGTNYGLHVGYQNTPYIQLNFSTPRFIKTIKLKRGFRTSFQRIMIGNDSSIVYPNNNTELRYEPLTPTDVGRVEIFQINKIFQYIYIMVQHTDMYLTIGELAVEEG